ncbi:hypothetical protein [Bradyrhizobium valentinum]|uniref:hypothetical protein n=1 Tax=Bradyrhizobium valentinum TaxID=1518501 RepID=UPI00070C5167|nr:hypothetical protein [Bradyrhizobium valentinum]KRR14253.1 hypothetical protein CQ10_00600 [Bradyrhizobium valentinum]
MEPYSAEYWIDKNVPEELVSLVMTPPRLLPGEKPEQYYRLLEGMMIDLCPEETVEWMWVVELAGLWFEINRLRLLKHALIPTARADVLDQVLAKTHPDAGTPGTNHLMRVKARAERQTLMQNPTDAELNSRLRAYGYDRDALHALAFTQNAEAIGFIDKMLASARKEVRAIMREMKNGHTFSERLAVAKYDFYDKQAKLEAERLAKIPQQEKTSPTCKDQE